MKQDREFFTLAQQYISGQIDARQMERLNTLLLDNPQLRREFIEMLNLDTALADHLAGWEVSPEETPAAPCFVEWPGFPVCEQTPPVRIGRASLRFFLLVTMAGLLLMLAWWLPAIPENSVARVAHTAGVAELAVNDFLYKDWHEIQVGTVELVTRRGVRVALEAPARFRFESDMCLHLPYGRMSADVPPPARGFRVITPSGQAIDLGTRFGVDVPVNGPAEIHVFEGEVIAQPISREGQRNLLGGEAACLNEVHNPEKNLRTAAFIRSGEVSELEAALLAGQQEKSARALKQLKNDPALIALLDFESESLPEGVYRMVQGRWPGSQAPEFINVGDHMKLDVGGEQAWPQFTLLAWVRLDRLGERFQSLLHTDGWYQNKLGQVHWMVTRHMTMRLALFENTLAADAIEQEQFPDSRTSVLPEQGRWMHLAVVYDADRKTVRFYLNGQFDSETHQEIAHPGKFGPAQIGNWNHQDRKLSGRVDELILLGRTMTDAEIQALFEAGNPYH